MQSLVSPQGSWLSQNHEQVAQLIKEHIPEAGSVVYDSSLDKLESSWEGRKIYFLGSEHINREAFVKSFNTDMLCLGLIKQIRQGQVRCSYDYSFNATENTNFLIKFQGNIKKINLDTDQKIYDYVNGVLDFSKLETEIKTQFNITDAPKTTSVVFRGMSSNQQLTNPDKITFSHIPL